MPTLEQIVKAEKVKGKTAIEVHKILRESNMPIPWVETKRIYLKS